MLFVSYCAEDRFWVHDTLAKELEDTYKFKLCIHYRDFAAGSTIFDEIPVKCSAVMYSKIIVVSETRR